MCTCTHTHTHTHTHRSLDPESLAPLTRLRELRIDDCGLRSLAGASRLAALTRLSAAGNRLADAVEVERAVGALGELREVALAGSPVARRPVRRWGLLWGIAAVRSRPVW
jgi:hypothetical protein